MLLYMCVCVHCTVILYCDSAPCQHGGVRCVSWLCCVCVQWYCTVTVLHVSTEVCVMTMLCVCVQWYCTVRVVRVGMEVCHDYAVCVCTVMLYCKSDPCKHGGLCHEATLGHTCDCCPAYTGDNCDTLVPGFTSTDVEVCDTKRENCFYTRGEVRLSSCNFSLLFLLSRLCV